MRRLNRTDAFILFFLSVLFIYVFIRSVLVDITNDEAYSFYIVKNFWYAEALCTGNTHWLNSLAIKLTVLFGFEEVWQIRWFSTFSTLFIFLLAFVWIRSVKELSFKFLILTLLLNPYILDYLSLARGYAPGLLFQCVALYFFISRFKENQIQPNFLSLLLAGFSAFSNFSFVYFFVAFSLMYFSFLYYKNFIRTLKSVFFYRDILFVIVLLAIIVRAFAFMSTCSNDVIGAGTENFPEYFEVMFQGLTPSVKISLLQSTLVSYLVFGILILSALNGILRSNASKNKIYYFSSIILLIMLSATFINGFFFGIVFPYYRSAIFLFPTTIICFVYLIAEISNPQTAKFLVNGFSFLLILSFILNINFKSVIDFHSQANSKESFDYLQSIKASNVALSPELYGVFRNYYQVKDGVNYRFSGEMIKRENRKKDDFNSPIKSFDYLLLVPPYTLNFEKDSSLRFKAVKFFPETGTLILRVD